MTHALEKTLEDLGTLKHCVLCAGVESPGFYTGCLCKDHPQDTQGCVCVEGKILHVLDSESLAALIRKVDGNHQLGASALADAIISEAKGKILY